jgi:hypothetical protein
MFLELEIKIDDRENLKSNNISTSKTTCMNFFNHCKTLDEVKTTYRQLALLHHPDKGGETATMQHINREYAFITAKLTKGANLSEDEAEKQMRFSEEYQRVVEQIINLEGITVELVGFWIWVTGDTFPVRAALSEAGLFYASKKVAWYYRSEAYKLKKGSNKTLDEIKVKYGSEPIPKTYRNSKNFLTN